MNNGLSVFIFHGEGIAEQDLIPSRQWNKPIGFNNVDINNVDTFVDVYEVGFTIFSKSDLFNSPEKISHYIPYYYLLDINSSDI
ncbi:hypothetical protein [Priestia megaterium]|uniref:hypothetical protein n=1 Tax=Priestia megaterium TaxID=1404 RepID=UPI001CDBDA0A|nr:hypothetical protein [Priestia megaterium]MCA4157878.1 hypothetical protein [Priestia megaterium]